MYRPTETRVGSILETRVLFQTRLAPWHCALALRLTEFSPLPLSNLQCPSGGLLRQPFLSPLPKAIPEDLLP